MNMSLLLFSHGGFIMRLAVGHLFVVCGQDGASNPSKRSSMIWKEGKALIKNAMS